MAINTNALRSLLLPGLLELTKTPTAFDWSEPQRVEFWRDNERDELIVEIQPVTPPVVQKSRSGQAIRLDRYQQAVAIKCNPNVPQAVAFAHYARALMKAGAKAAEKAAEAERAGRTPLILDGAEVGVPMLQGRDLDLE